MTVVEERSQKYHPLSQQTMQLIISVMVMVIVVIAIVIIIVVVEAYRPYLINLHPHLLCFISYYY